MNQQPDKFFRQKLEGFNKPAPASAWEKITAAQHKKNNKGLWLKIAASLLAIAVATYLLLPDVGNPPQQAVVPPETTIPESVREPAVPLTSDNQLTSDLKDEQKEQRQKSNLQTARVDTTQPTEIIAEDIHSDTYDSIPPFDLTSSEELTLAQAETQHSEPSFLPAENITLVFTAAEVNEYLDKKSLDEATDSTKKSSTWKKLLKKANNLTNNQDPFGELRQKKNEILALNFKNEKQRDQNK